MYDAVIDSYCYEGTTVLKNIPDIRDQAALDAFEAAVTFFDAVPAFHIELPLVLGAGQGAAFECQFGYVCALVRAPAI